VREGLWNYIRLPARDGPIPVFTTCSHCGYTSTVHTITGSAHESPLAIESLLNSLLDSLLDGLLDSLRDSLLGRNMFERATLWEE
jgi:hypothetical protein